MASLEQVVESPVSAAKLAWPRMSNSILVGKVAHTRKTPSLHRFLYGLYMPCVAVDDVSRLVSKRRWMPFSFQASDHMKGADGELSSAVRDVVQRETGTRPRGPIYLLTQFRCFGFYFSPLNLYFCYDSADADEVVAVVAEVNNTPWGEQHHYVLHSGNAVGEATAKADGYSLRFAHDKTFHVSPFMDMESRYEWRFSAREDGISIVLACRKTEGRVFHASMMLKKKRFTHWRLWQTALRFPWMTLQIVAAIYWQALKLWWKKCPFYSHPNKRPSNSPSGPATQ